MIKNIFLLLVFISTIFPIKAQLDTSLTLEKKKLVILPSQNKETDFIADKLLSIISSQASSIGRFEIIDRNIVDDILKEQKFQLSGSVLDKDIIAIGELAAAEEALILEIIHFGQKGIPLEKKNVENTSEEDHDETLFSWFVKTAVKAAIEEKKTVDTLRIGLQLRNNIQTIIEANIKFINIESGTLLKSIPISASYTGGNKDASLIKVFNSLTRQVRWKLKDLYMINSEIIEIEKRNVTIFSGKNLGLKKGEIFEISSSDQLKTYKGKSITLPGKAKGLMRIINVGPDASIGKIIRKWKNINPGDKAYELKNAPKVTSLNFSLSRENKYELSGKFIFNTFSDLSPSINGYLGSIKDSRNEMNGYLGFGTNLEYRFLSIFGTTYSTSLELPALFSFRNDDKGHNVASFLSAPSINFNIAIQISPYRDLFLSTKYTFTQVHGPWQWQKSTGELNKEGNNITETEPAVWTGTEPKFNLPGLYFSIGLRRISF